MSAVQFETSFLYGQMANSQKSIIQMVGGARSTKSYTTAQYLVGRLLSQPKCKILITRKTLPALKRTAERVFIEILQQKGVYDIDCHNRTDREYHYGDRFVCFSSTDEAWKRQSEEWNYVQMEEATEFVLADFLAIDSRMSAWHPEGEINKIILNLNPSDESHFTHKVLEPRSDVDTFYSTVDDNPWLDQAYKDKMEAWKEIDPVYYNVMRLGQWAAFEGLYYTHWSEATTSFPVSDVCAGLDFGYSNPTALVETSMADDGLHVRECLYKDKMTNGDLIAWLNAVKYPKDRTIYADAAEPQRIEEIQRAGYRISPAKKVVKDGIDYVMRFHLYVHDSVYAENQENIQKEIRHYRRREVNDRFIDEPVKLHDHAMDAMRYAAFSQWGGGVQTFEFTRTESRFTKFAEGAL